MSKHPCRKGPDGTPCRSSDQCRPCYLFKHSLKYNLAWGGDGQVVCAPSTPATREAPKPKRILLGEMVTAGLVFVGATEDGVERSRALLGKIIVAVLNPNQ